MYKYDHPNQSLFISVDFSHFIHGTCFGFILLFLCQMFLLLSTVTVLNLWLSWEYRLKRILTCTKHKWLPTFTCSFSSTVPLQSSAAFSSEENSTEFLTEFISCTSCSSAFSWQKDTHVYNNLNNEECACISCIFCPAY